MVQVEAQRASTLKVDCRVLFDWFDLAETEQSLALIVFFLEVFRLDQVGRPHVVFQNLRYYVFLLQLRLVVVFSVVDVCLVCVGGRSFDVRLKQLL